MRLALNLAIVVATVAATELLAYAVHRYVMHGVGWAWHRSHHEPRGGPFEKNDWYAVAFAAAALALILGDTERGPAYWVGIGMTVYGLAYFVVHDLLTHRRWLSGGAASRGLPRGGYLQRLVQAHRLHHAVRGRDGAVSFGFLYAPPVRALKTRLAARGGLRS